MRCAMCRRFSNIVRRSAQTSGVHKRLFPSRKQKLALKRVKIEIHFYYVVCSATFRLQSMCSTTLRALILLSDTFRSPLSAAAAVNIFFLWRRWYPSFILIYCYLETELFNFFPRRSFVFFLFPHWTRESSPPTIFGECQNTDTTADFFCSGTKWNGREKTNSIKLSIRYQSIYQNGFRQPIGLFPCTTLASAFIFWRKFNAIYITVSFTRTHFNGLCVNGVRLCALHNFSTLVLARTHFACAYIFFHQAMFLNL